MAQLGRLHDIFHRPTGVPAAGATVTVRRQGATATSNQSHVTPFAVAVADCGNIQAGDTVQINTGSTTYTVDSIATGVVTISGFAGTLAILQGDRLTPVNNLPTLKADSQGVNNLSPPNPMTTDVNGEFAAWADVSPYDLRVSGGGFGDRLFADVWPAGVVLVRVNADPNPSGVGYIFDVRGLPASGEIISFRLNGADVFHINADGTISGTVAVSVPDPLTLVNGLTVNALATFNAGAGVVGGLTVDNFTGTGTFTVAAGAIASAALANNAATAAPVVTRGSSSLAALATSESVRVSVSYTPAGTTSAVMITFAAPYLFNASTSNASYAKVNLYVDGVLQFPFINGPTSQDVAGELLTISFTWPVTGLSNAAHTIEVRDQKVTAAGAGSSVTYKGDLVQAALTILEHKK